MRVFAVVFVALSLLSTAAFAEKEATKAKPKRVAATTSAKPSEVKKQRDRSIGAPWSGRLQGPVRLKEGKRYHLRRPWRTYATRTTVDLVRQAIVDTLDDLPKAHALAIGDLSQESGGWISEHASHQSGRDIDIGLFYKKQPKGYPASFIRATATTLDPAATFRLIANFAKTRGDDGGVQFIFLDQGLQNVLLAWAEKAGVSEKRIANVVAVLRHIPHHADHIHVRFKCRERDSGCR
ncbi:MAG: penicillin-insensitive murein endopeptidase [Deltaproteobacteria bacterium]|nr:penicillin-insensitive murein endopeptidase [Deltaproteobacteria bacterium]